jgi:hypothetical protein
MSSSFSNFLAKKINYPNFILERKEEYLKTFPIGKRQNLCQAKNKHWNSATELMIWPIHKQQPTTCTRELLAHELAQCSQCSLIWDENMHVGIELVEHKCELRHKLYPFFFWGHVWHGVSRPKPKRISKIQKNLVFGWGTAFKGQLTRDTCTLDKVFFWSHILRIVHQVLLWSVN